MAAKKKNTEGFAFLVNALEKDKNAVYADVKAAAEKKGLVVHPIMFGRAKLKLGHVKAGAGKMKLAAAKARGLAVSRTGAAGSDSQRRGPGRPRKNGLSSSGHTGLEGVIAAVKDSQHEVGRYRGALEKIQGILADALAR